MKSTNKLKKLKPKEEHLTPKNDKSKNSYKEYLAKLTDLNWDGND